jgi:uncharacterized membrane protein
VYRTAAAGLQVAPLHYSHTLATRERAAGGESAAAARRIEPSGDANAPPENRLRRPLPFGRGIPILRVRRTLPAVNHRKNPMADFPTPTQASVPANGVSVTPALIVYLLFAIGAVVQVVSMGLPHPFPLVSLIGFVGVIVAHVKRGDARGTWVESHYRWQIRTFWWSLLWSLVGLLLLVVFAIVLVGFLIGPMVWALVSIWVLYRVIRGYLAFKDSRPVPGM